MGDRRGPRHPRGAGSPAPAGRGQGNGEEGAVNNLDMRLHDHVALDEIELYAEVLTAVAISERRLSVEEIDEVLGLRVPVGQDVTR